MARAYIGTSGWSYKNWIGEFYPAGLHAGRWLEHYAQQFDTVELNASFYRLLSPAAIAGWVKRTPDGFTFAVKASKLITHNLKLHDAGPALTTLLDNIAGFGAKLGPLLFQLPPRWGMDTARLAEFLALLPPGQRCAFELRDRSWLDEAVYALLRQHNAAFCIYDLGGFESPHVVTADFVYIRLHGPGRVKYVGSYSGPKLDQWGAELRCWLDDGRDVYCYFDNTDGPGAALADAVELREMLADPEQ
jgi:uncharacterized protein YecE (DUF72 family)